MLRLREAREFQPVDTLSIGISKNYITHIWVYYSLLGGSGFREAREEAHSVIAWTASGLRMWVQGMQAVLSPPVCGGAPPPRGC